MGGEPINNEKGGVGGRGSGGIGVIGGVGGGTDVVARIDFSSLTFNVRVSTLNSVGRDCF